MSRAELAQALRAVVGLKIADDNPRARAGVAAIENAIEILEQEPIVCDKHESGVCAGPVHLRQCADCEHPIARCEEHGGRKSVSRYMWLHREQQHRRSA